MPRPRLPHLIHEANRHGRMTWVVRIGKGARVRLREPFGTPEFIVEYQAALAKLTAGIEPKAAKAKKSTLGWLIDRYKASGEYAALRESSREVKDRLLAEFVRNAGDVALKHIDRAAIAKGRDDRRERGPGAANAFLKTVSALFAWALDAGLVNDNPARGVKRLPPASAEGFHTWTEAEIESFESKWPIGTRQRLMLDVMINTGLRRADAARLGPEHVNGGMIGIIAEKNGIAISIPMTPALAESVRATTPAAAEAFVCKANGKRYTVESFGNDFADACRAAGVPGSAHGLRKAAAVRLALAGATERQLMAVFGWTDPDMAARYTRAADRARLGMQAGALLAQPRQIKALIGQEFDALAA